MNNKHIESEVTLISPKGFKTAIYYYMGEVESVGVIENNSKTGEIKYKMFSSPTKDRSTEDMLRATVIMQREEIKRLKNKMGLVGLFKYLFGKDKIISE